jgi:signal transduction histidine kinase
MKDWLPRLAARVPAGVHAKLLAAFLAIVVLLIGVGAVGLYVLSQTNRRTIKLVELQRKIAAYRQLQYDTAAQLHSVASALLALDEQTLNATLRQLDQFGYDYDRLQFVAKDEAALLDEVRKDYDQFIQIVTRVVELIRAGKAAEGRALQLAQATPLADRLDLVTNQLVNEAEAEMIAGVDASDGAYLTSRWVIIGFAAGSIGLAVVLGYAFSWSLIGPVKEMDARLKQIASGDFSQHIQVLNRDELGTLATNMNRMNDELGQLYQQIETANQHKSQFLASVNHDLRTPVSAIIGYARLLRRETEGRIAPLQRENLDDLLHNAERLLRMIDSLLEFAKIEAGKVEVMKEPVAVDTFIQEVAATVQSTLNNDKVKIIPKVAPDIPSLITDREKLRQIALNLLDNAVKFTESGEIKIAAAQCNGALKLAVSDTGIGIAEEDLHHLFEEFYRGKSATRGTGLGLAIVKRFVSVLGGEIAVESEMGKGSTFIVTLPLEQSKHATIYSEKLAS